MHNKIIIRHRAENVNIKLLDLCESLIVYILLSTYQSVHMTLAINKLAILLMLCPSPTVPNLLPNEDELTIRVCSGDHS